MVTTIQVDEKLKARLDSLKIHRRETYNDIILRLVGSFSPKNADRESLMETIEVMSDPETMKEIARALEDYEKGNWITLEQLKRELRL